MKLAVTSKKWKTKEIEALIVPIASKEHAPAGLPPLATQLLADAIKRKEFNGLKGEMLSFVMPITAGQTLRHVVFVGIGKLADMIFGRVPDFADIVTQLRALEQEINGSSQGEHRPA